MVAARYQPHRSLIGPELFPFYWFTVKRVLPWVIGIWLLVTAVTIIFGSPNTSIAQRVDVGHIITGLFGAAFQFLAWITLGFALLEYFKGHLRNTAHRVLLHDTMAMTFHEVRYRRNRACPVCGDRPTIHDLVDPAARGVRVG